MPSEKNDKVIECTFLLFIILGVNLSLSIWEFYICGISIENLTTDDTLAFVFITISYISKFIQSICILIMIILINHDNKFLKLFDEIELNWYEFGIRLWGTIMNFNNINVTKHGYKHILYVESIYFIIIYGFIFCSFIFNYLNLEENTTNNKNGIPIQNKDNIHESV